MFDAEIAKKLCRDRRYLANLGRVPAMDVIHTAIWVSDLDATREYYIDALGLEHTWDFERDGVTNFYVGGSSETEIQFKYDPGRTEPIEPKGIDHLAVAVDDTDAMLEHMVEETGCEILGGPMEVAAANAYVAFIEDPDGYGVELVESLD